MHKPLRTYKQTSVTDNDESIVTDVSLFEEEEGIHFSVSREKAQVKSGGKITSKEEETIEIEGLSGEQLATIQHLMDEWLESESHATISDDIPDVSGDYRSKKPGSFHRNRPETSHAEFDHLFVNVGEYAISFNYSTENGFKGVEIPSAESIDRGSYEDIKNVVILNDVLYDFFRNRYSGDIDELGIETPVDVEKGAIGKVEHIFNQFGEVTSQLSQPRRKNKQAINDEDDMQYLLHALLRLEFDDIRDEAYFKQYANKSPRIDFLLEDHKIGIETKILSETRPVNKIRKEIIEDKEEYAADPDCDKLLVLIYDPDRVFPNYAELERDLSGATNNLTTRVTVTH